MTDGPSAPGRLDQVLAAAAGISRSQAQAWIAAGCVRVNGTVATRAALRLRGPEALAWEPPPERPSSVEPERVELAVLYEDDVLIALDKPPGMATHPAPGLSAGTLVNALLGRVPLAGEREAGTGGPLRSSAQFRPGIVHRLDRDTSGVIVVAKTARAQARLQASFKAREARKTYLAVAVGSLPERVRVDAPIGRHPLRRERMAVGGTAARDADTLFLRLAAAPGHALVRAEPRTGRTHQIRVHLAHLRAPVLGDATYGRPSSAIARQALHAWKLELPHPVTGDPLRLEAPPPADLVAAWLAVGGVWPAELG